jgi:hypothetical protein
VSRSVAATPKGKLVENVLYFGDNGRITCGSLRCAGMSAFYSGRTISGQRVKRVTRDDNALFVAEFGEPACCEVCKRAFTEQASSCG